MVPGENKYGTLKFELPYHKTYQETLHRTFLSRTKIPLVNIQMNLGQF